MVSPTPCILRLTVPLAMRVMPSVRLPGVEVAVVVAPVVSVLEYWLMGMVYKGGEFWGWRASC